jgi:hypothetical protein
MFETINFRAGKKERFTKGKSLYHRCMKGQSTITPTSLYSEI